jgi:SAM-dependent methyltransferase
MNSSPTVPSKYTKKHVRDAMRLYGLAPFYSYPDVSEEQLKRAFGFVAATVSEPYHAALKEIVTQNLLPSATRPVAVLDVGAGVGRLAYDLARTEGVSQVVALDNVRELVDEITLLAEGTPREVEVPIIANERLKAILVPPEPATKLTARFGDALHIPYPDHSFDCVISAGTLDRVLHPIVLVDELFRVTTNGGLVILVSHHDWGQSPTPSKEYISEASKLFQSKERWLECNTQDLPLTMRDNARYAESFSVEVVVARKRL